MTELGYKGVISEKKNGKSACAIFYKDDKYELMEGMPILCELAGNENENLEMPLVHIRNKLNACEAVFAQVHLKAKSGSNSFDAQRI